jgi:ABC-type dipeptide/oligopeptide/nickel transport system ATPase subunit
LRVQGVSRTFGSKRAIRNVSLTLDRGGALGIVGASGSGKSTLARCIARFERPDSGEILLDGRSVYGAADVQLIVQEAAASLNPRFTAEEILEEPLLIQRRGGSVERRRKAADWLAAVGLPPGSGARLALAFSGGERQRLALARALILEPKLLILDESFSSLDVPLQAQLTALLDDLRRRLGLTAIFIAHDLILAARMAAEIAVMSDGEIVERGPSAELLVTPRHPRARELVEASRSLSLPGALA